MPVNATVPEPHCEPIRPGMVFDLVADGPGAFLLTFIVEKVEGAKLTGDYHWREGSEEYQGLVQQHQDARRAGDVAAAEAVRDVVRALGLRLARRSWVWVVKRLNLGAAGVMACEVERPRRNT